MLRESSRKSGLTDAEAPRGWCGAARRARSTTASSSSVWFLGASLLLTLGANAHASPWTIDDLIRYQDVAGTALSADGSMAAWVRTEVVAGGNGEGGERRVGHLFLYAANGNGEPWQATFGDDRIASPAFSPDGEQLAFLSDRALPGKGSEATKGKMQLWVLPLGGGEARALTRFDRSVRDFAWRDDRKLVVVAQEARTARDRALEEGKDTSVVVEDAQHEPPVRLFGVTLEGKVDRLTSNTDWIDELAVSPDGRWAVVRAQRSLSYEFDGLERPQVRLVDLANGTGSENEQVVLDDPALYVGSLHWSRDSQRVYFSNAYSHDPLYRTATIDQLWVFDVASREHHQLGLDWPRGLAGGVETFEDDDGQGFIALLEDGIARHPRRYARSGATGDALLGEDLTGEHADRIDAWTLSADGSAVLYRHSTATTPPQLYIARLEGAALVDPKRLTHLNPDYDSRPLGRTEVLSWKGALGDTVEGLLHYPYDYQEGQRYPLVLNIHGGPAGASRDSWDANWHSPVRLIRQRGAFVLQANYHGSSSYGLDWVESIGGGKYYELEPIDLENGVDYVIDRGQADPDRLGVTGWSNGGILSAELITRSRRYKVASIGAADVEWISDWANVDFGATFDNYYFGASPWQNPQLYIDKSPFFRLPEVTTPTIVFTGTEDRNVPPHESWSLFRGLQQNTKTPVRLVLFPGEPHGLRQIAHQRRKLEEEMAWLDRYLLGGKEAAPEWLHSGSPLAGLLARARSARVQGGVNAGRYGLEVGGVLVPETVAFDGLRVGRFEVTRAQFAVFEGREVAAEEANLPASGVSLERARAYVAWLSRTTGRSYRLPSVVEAERWAQAAGRSGNTFEHWASYSPTPEERAAIAQQLDAGSLSLLLEVGSFAPTASPGEPGTPGSGVFDLDGNVAEWALADDDSGRAVGPSAERAKPPRGSELPVDPAYIGLRVVRESDM